MIDLILTSPAEGPATLFTRNFRVHSGIPIGLYDDGPRSPVALVYGDLSNDVLEYYSDRYQAVIGIPSFDSDRIPDNPLHYETMTVKAPILATVREISREGFSSSVQTFEGSPLILEGQIRGSVFLLFTADLIKSTILILSGDLELRTGLDEYGRHNPAPDSVIEAPAVSLHFNLIENAIRAVYRKLGLPLLSIPRWPSAAPLTLFLSHDVDAVKKWTAKRTAYEILRSLWELVKFRGRPFISTIESLYDAMRSHDPYWNFDDLLFFEESNGFNSTWFFAPFGGEFQHRANSIDPVYHRKPSEINAMMRKIVENGCEIALHGIRDAYLEADDLRRQLDSFETRLGFKLHGVRHHYLMFRHGATLETAAEAGLEYDTTLGFSRKPGFRNGMAAPFFMHPVNHPAGGIIEIPLHVMDTVFLDEMQSSETIKRRIIESYLYAKAAGGMFGMLVHPGNMDPADFPELRNFYHSFLPRCKLDDAVSMTGREISDWWSAREEVLRAMEYSDNSWRIQGVEIPQNMLFNISVPNITSMKFAIEGASGSSGLNHDTLSIRPGPVDPGRGLTIIRKN